MSIFDKFARGQSQKKQHSNAAELAERSVDETHLQQALDRWTTLANADENDLESRLKLIEVNNALGNNAEVEQLISDLDSRFDTVRGAQLIVARHYLNTNENDKALEKWSKFDQQYTDQHESCNNLAHLCIRSGDFDEAHKYTNILAERHGLVGKAHEIRSNIYGKQQLWPEAIDSLTKALAKEPKDELELRLILALVKDNQLDEATKRLDEGLDKNPGCIKRLSLKQLMLQRKKDWQSALDVVDKLIGLQAANNSLLVTKSDLLYKLSRLDESEALCEQVLKEEPQNIQALTVYARISQIRLNRLQAA